MTIDEPTAAIIREAMAAAQAGRLKDACEVGERAVRGGLDSPPLRALLGGLLIQMADYRSALSHLEAAALASPGDVIIARNRAIALVGLERFVEALEILPDAVVAADPTFGLLRLRAYAAHMGGGLEAGVADYTRYLERHGEDWESWNNLGNAYVSMGNLDAAIEALSRAAALNPRAAPTRLNLARSLRDLGETERAAVELRAMARDFPRDPNPLLDLYHILRSAGRPESEAEEVLAEAARRDPANPEVLSELGSQQLRIFELDKAERTFRELLGIDPANIDAFLGLAQVFEHNQPQRLAGLAAEAEAAGLEDLARLNLIRAFAARRSKDFEQGLAAMETIPADVEPTLRWHLAGHLLDALGRHDEAFAAFSAMNEAQSADESRPLERAAALRAQLRTRLSQLTSDWRAGWKAPPIAPPRPAPVFLAGFPRSGTTLLDTMLLGHPGVSVMEERPIFRQLDQEFGGFDALDGMDEDAVRRMQARYFELAAEHADLSEQKLLIDKSPLYLHRVPHILRLFPDARFILAMRHPADALLSCFMANFRLNNSMSNFLELGSAAEFYDLSFSLWERSREVFEVDARTVVYERMVANPEAELRPIADALGLDWDARMVDHQATAKSRGVITTASYAQVTQPLYTTSVGRWQNYRSHLEPVLPMLEPWIRKFGYST